MGTPTDPLRVAYLVNTYPAVSHTFIRREIAALERTGAVVLRIAIRGRDEPVVDAADIEERSKTRYVLDGGPIRLLAACLRTALRTPRALLTAARLAWKMSRDSERPLATHLAYLCEACVIREWLDAAGSSHLHAHFAQNPAEVAMLVSVLGGVPYSFTAHGSDIINRPAQIGLPQTVGRAAFVAAVSAFGRSQICRWVAPELWSKVVVVRCGLERTWAGTEPKRPPSSQRSLLCIGRLSAEKGQLVLLEALALLAQRGDRVELVMVGDGPMRRAIEEFVQRNDLASLVTMTGSLDSAAVKETLERTRALVVPSLSEGLPVVIMEAMAMGRPVIAPYLAGIPELVRDGENGWLFPAGDASAMASAIRRSLATDDAEIDAMGDRAREAVLERHDVDRETARLSSLFARSGTRGGNATGPIIES